MVMQELKRGKNGTVFHSKNGIETKKKHGMPLMSGGHRIGQQVPLTQYRQRFNYHNDPNKNTGNDEIIMVACKNKISIVPPL